MSKTQFQKGRGKSRGKKKKERKKKKPVGAGWRGVGSGGGPRRCAPALAAHVTPPPRRASRSPSRSFRPLSS
eukprot:3348504-Rhodomonas_salina.1